MDPQKSTEPTTTTSTNSETPKGSWQDRLNQLTRRASEAERVASQTVTENTQLREQLGRLEQQISQLASRPAPAASPDTSRDFSGADNPGSFETLAAKIKEEVLGAVRPLLEEVQQDKVNTQLASKAQQSFTRAMQVHPELRNPESQLFQTFMQLWDNRPDLQRIDGAPEILVEAARGLLSEARATEQVRKMAAAADTPRNPRQLDVMNSDNEVTDALDKLVDVGKNDGWGQDELGDYIALKLKQTGLG